MLFREQRQFCGMCKTHAIFPKGHRHSGPLIEFYVLPKNLINLSSSISILINVIRFKTNKQELVSFSSKSMMKMNW